MRPIGLSGADVSRTVHAAVGHAFDTAVSLRDRGVQPPGQERTLVKNHEVELKLELDSADIDALLSSPILAAVDECKHEQTSIYFDTPEQLLRAADLSLRIRKIGMQRIQTVKFEGRGATGLFVRPEWEMPVDRGHPVIGEIDCPLRTLISVRDGQQLSSIFQSVVTRQTRLLAYGGAQIELVLDQGEIGAAGRNTPICEVELELKQGPPNILFALAKALDQVSPLQLSALSKWQRGLQLLDGSADQAVRALPMRLPHDMVASEGLSEIAHACIRQFRLNQSILARTPDLDALHQARVALRRLRSTISIFRELLADNQYRYMLDGLHWVARELDTARNIDVLLGRTQDVGMRQLLQKHRPQAYAAAVAACISQRLRTLMLDLVEWIAMGRWLTDPADRMLLDQPLVEFAGAALDRCRKRVKRSGNDWIELDDIGRHKLRIQTKKLHYATDFFGSLFRGKHTTRRHTAFLKALKTLQKALGDLNDHATGAELLAQLDLPPGLATTSSDAIIHKSMLKDAQEAYEALIDAKRFWW